MVSGRIIQWVRDRERRRIWRRLTRVLRLTRRAAVSKDGLSLSKVSTSLDIEWYARDVHPWDADLPSERRAKLFAEESLTNTVVAIHRAFERFPEVDAIEIRVLEPRAPHAVIFSGVVSREDLNQCSASLSPGMTLKVLGIAYRLIDGELKPVC